MPRWKPDAVERLQTAALELFDEQGFERTTVAEIVQRAGLTQRTFFNHFADKREVLFVLSSQLQQEIISEIAAGDDTLPPLDAVVRALGAVADRMFEHQRAVVTRRYAVVAANPELQERELGKNAALTEAIAAVLHARGCDPETAFLAAGAAMLAQQAAFRKWTRPDETRTLRDLLPEALHSLRASVDRQPVDPPLPA
ncbi:TetR/AcrR family transcriptional regulator [Saccharothrix coeruleofusca]|uniref:TetR family transcriptional regulator n=1 Tax=Saccharothrix coeruleofusca TaxID=33919 RepID=A0A918EGG2_9PSEU|nr:TetR/AcrR family transcriptional regulator [Saccharothrix coeruleofusca]MBP2337300.1 AcrR family transcriptional regulator [Saccharothrix coeruleofusca]GGP81631.1 TetR family transcriptional regulator [Saccharothrix coeruleofusca]